MSIHPSIKRWGAISAIALVGLWMATYALNQRTKRDLSQLKQVKFQPIKVIPATKKIAHTKPTHKKVAKQVSRPATYTKEAQVSKPVVQKKKVASKKRTYKKQQRRRVHRIKRTHSASSKKTAAAILVERAVSKPNRKAVSKKSTPPKKTIAALLAIQAPPKKKTVAERLADLAPPQNTASVVSSLSDEGLLEWESDEMAQAVDQTSPMDRWVVIAFAETVDSQGYDPNPRLSKTQLDAKFVVNWKYPSIPEYGEVVGLLAQNDFKELKGALSNIQEKAAALNALPALPKELKIQKPTLAKAPPAESKATVDNTPALEKPGPLFGRPMSVATQLASYARKQKQVRIATIKEKLNPEPLPKPSTNKEEEKPNLEIPPGGSPEVYPPKTHRTIMDVDQYIEYDPTPQEKNHLIAQNEVVNQPGPTSNVSNQPVLVVPQAMTTQPSKKIEELKKPTPDRPTQKQPRSRVRTAVVAQTSSESHPDKMRAGGKVFGTLDFDSEMAKWLEQEKGHVELYLHPILSSDPQDTVFLDYRFPDRNFEFDARHITGKYYLLAGIFRPNLSMPVVQIRYRKPISKTNHKEKVRFYLTKTAFDRATKHRQNRTHFVNMNLTVFEGAAGNYREPPRIKESELKIVGFPEWGTLKADQQGNIRIPNVPTASQLLFEVSAPGYYTTHRVVPIFQSDVYSTLYLISKDKVSAIKEGFTGSKQLPGKAVVMGRIYDPITRLPQRDQQVNLTLRKRALYFGVWPDKKLRATTDLGLFGFFNISNSIRFLSGAGRAAAALLNLRPDTAHFVEFGRGGKRSLLGKVVDPFLQSMPEARVSIMGDAKTQVYTDEQNRFEVAGIDLSPGVLVVQVEAPEYPLTWHTVPWNARQPQKPQTLYMLEKALLNEAKNVAHIREEEGVGTVLGAAEASLFRGRGQCLFVELLNAEGQKVSPNKGPLPMKPIVSRGEKLCLTPQNSSFAYYNLPDGEYIFKWLDGKERVFRTRVLYVGRGRTSILVN